MALNVNDVIAGLDPERRYKVEDRPAEAYRRSAPALADLRSRSAPTELS